MDLGVRTELKELKDEIQQAAEALRESLKLQKKIVERRIEISEKVVEEPVVKPKRYPYFTYPRDGTKKTVGKGTTVLDFYDGTVILPDGTADRISDSLQAHNEPYIRSFQVDTNKAIKIWLDGYGKKPVDLDDIHLETQQTFRRLYIETTESTIFHVWASTQAEAYIRRLKPAIFRGVINENYTVINPLAEFGTPKVGIDPGYYSGTDTTYQTLASWTIAAGNYGYLREISFTADSLARYQLTIGGVQLFTDLQLISPLSLPFPPNKYTAGTVILLEVKSAGGAIEVNGFITGKEVSLA